jgi:hypothetical protein
LFSNGSSVCVCMCFPSTIVNPVSLIPSRMGLYLHCLILAVGYV